MALSLRIGLTFDGFSLSVDQTFAADGVTAVFGRSGSGKTTLFRVIAGLERRARGTVAFGSEIWQDDRTFVPPHRRRIGLVFQDARLFPHLSVEGNLAYALRRAPRDPAALDLAAVVRRFDLAPLLARRPAALSGGETQRVALARALLTRPRLLLMDEPLAALDAQRKADILPYLERMRDGGGVPTLYVSHSVSEVARLADRIVILQQGRVVRAGPLTDVLADPAAVPFIGVREAGALIAARVVAHHDDGVTELAASAGPLFVPGRVSTVGQSLRLRIEAQDVILARHRPEGLSALNILPVTVAEVRPGDGPGVAVALQAGGDRLLARVTRRSATALGLAPGLDCFAVVKSVSVAQGDIGAAG